MRQFLCSSLLCVALIAGAVLPSQAGGIAPSGLAQQGGNQPGQTLTSDSLRTLLVNLGYQPSAHRYGDGQPYYEIAVQYQGQPYTMTVEVGPNGRLVTLGMLLTRELAAMDRNRLYSLLQENDRMASHFVIGNDAKGVKSLYLVNNFNNRAVSAAVLQAELNSFLADMRQSEPAWRAPAVPAPTPATQSLPTPWRTGGG